MKVMIINSMLQSMFPNMWPKKINVKVRIRIISCQVGHRFATTSYASQLHEK